MISNASKNNIGVKIPHFKVETNSLLLKIRMKNRDEMTSEVPNGYSGFILHNTGNS